MSGKLVAGFIVVIALVMGAAIYWLQVYAYYEAVVFTPGREIELTPLAGPPEAIPVKDIRGIDAPSSPLRFRACFTTVLGLDRLTESFKVYDRPAPLIAPPWFDCFDAGRIDAALETGEAVAFLSRADLFPPRQPLKPGEELVTVDRVVAVFPDGRGYAWNQLAPGTEE